MTKLNALRTEIARLRARRQWLRLATAWVALATALLWALLAVFALDVYFDLSRGQRLLVLLFAAGGVAWAWFRFVRPWLGIQESAIDIALLVERQQGIESDLVAAMQFESAEASQWGSRQLEEAVIASVASLGSGIDASDEAESLRLRRRAIVLALTAAVLVGITLLAPAYVGAFMNRLAFGGRHYPSETEIRQAMINGQMVDLQPGSVNRLYSPVGQPLALEVVASGSVPEVGQARLVSQHDGKRMQITLEPVIADDAEGDASADEEVTAEPRAGDTPAERMTEENVVYTGELARLLETVKLQFYLGDAYTDPISIEVIPLPAITAELKVTPPEYAAQIAPQLAGQGLQQSVAEGSRVELEIVESSKPLESAWITLQGETPEKLNLEPADEEGLLWRLPLEETPFASVAERLRFELDVLDRDGQNLSSPLAGHVRIQADQPPRVLSTSTVHRVVLPTAQPVLKYSALDDYGLEAIDLVVQIDRLDGTVEDQTVTLYEGEPITADALPVEVSRPLELSQWGLQPGEHVRMFVRVRDHRGELEGVEARGDGIELKVADRSQLYAAIGESDLEAEELMTSIIDQHIGTGDSP